MAEANEPNKTSEDKKAAGRRRGTGFPVLPLSQAATLVKEAGKYGVEHAPEAIAGYLGHTTTNSGGFKQKTAALRDWGLISRNGHMIVITELGRKIAFPQNDTDEKNALMEAFRSSEVFAKVYDTSAKGTPLALVSIANTAVQNLGVSPASRDEFSKSLAESAVAAGLAEQPADGQLRFLAGMGVSGDEPRDDESPEEREEERGKKTQQQATGAGIRQVWPMDGVELVFEIRSERALPGKAYSGVAEVIDKVEALATLLNLVQEKADAAE